jgi:2-methylcitrate dehydratase PrpD
MSDCPPAKAHSEDVAVPVARFIASTTYGQAARDDVEAAKKLILDVLGAAVVGRFEPGCIELLGLMTEFGRSGQACVIGGGRLPVPAAVAVNATMCRALELDDVSEQALIHTAASAVPAALAAADHSAEPVSGERLIASVAVGVEVANRLSLAPGRVMDGPQYRPRGMSYSFQIGTLAAAAAAASIWGFDAETVLNALGLAYSQAAGNQQGVIDEVLAVRVQQGLSASARVLAAMMAGRGVSGAVSPLEGKFGYYPVYCGGQWDRGRSS